LYIKGLSPGPGLPSPLLDFADVVETYMPYHCRDHAKNPWAICLVLNVLSGVAALFYFVKDGPKRTPLVHCVVTILFVVMLGWFLKFRAVAYCIRQCVNSYALAITEKQPDALVAFSWGGGIATGLIAQGLWSGPTILIAPAGHVMWSHAGLDTPSLASAQSTSQIVIVHGTEDSVVGIDQSKALAQSACTAPRPSISIPHSKNFRAKIAALRKSVVRIPKLRVPKFRFRGKGYTATEVSAAMIFPGQVKLVVGEGEDHFCTKSVTQAKLQEWILGCMENSQPDTVKEDCVSPREELVQ